jgi:hypothetical protein
MKIGQYAFVAGALVSLSACGAQESANPPAEESQPMSHISGDSDAEAILLQRPADAAFLAIPGVPECTTIAPLRGDMANGPSTLMVRMTTNCLVPNHWHTPSEELVVLQGAPLAQMKGEKAQVLEVGSYSQLPSGHIHRFRCISEEDCLIFVVADAAFDIHYLDTNGDALSPEDAITASALDDGSNW